MDVDGTAAVRVVVEHRLQEVAVGLQAVELERPQGQREAPDRGGPVSPVGHELGHQGVVGGAHDAAGLDRPVDTHAGPPGPAHVRRRPGRGPVPLPGPLGTQADLDRVPRR